MGKLTRSRVLRGGAGLRGAPRGGEGARNFPHHVGQGGDGVRKINAGWGRRLHPSAPPCPIVIPNIHVCVYIYINCFQNNSHLINVPSLGLFLIYLVMHILLAIRRYESVTF